MKLISLEMSNFRQFVGSQKLDIAQGGPGSGNVTLVHAANGAGKTTILNAFTWVLHGTTGPDFEQKERLVTDSVWDAAQVGDEVECSVSLNFEHDGVKYLLRREVKARKESHQQRYVEPRVYLSSCDGGPWREEPAHTDILELIIPSRLTSFFFFNGERIEQLVQREAYAQIQDAIKTLLGLEQFDLALEHLPAVRNTFGSEIRKRGTPKAGRLEGARESLQTQIAALTQEAARLEGEQRDCRGEREELEQQLRESAGAAQLQKRREDQQHALARAEATRADARGRRTDTLARKAYSIWLARLWPDAAKVGEGLHESGELPAKLKEQFVDELLQRGRCICDTALLPGHDPYLHVAAWRQKAGLAEVESAWNAMTARAKGIETLAQEAAETLRASTTQIAEADDAYRMAESHLNQIGREIEEVGQVDVQRLERRRSEVNAKLEKLAVELHDAERKMKAANADLERVKGDLAKASGDDKTTEVLQRCATAVDDAHDAIQAMFDAAKQNVRRRLDAKLRQVHAQISIKDFVPELNEKFELNLWDGQGVERRAAPKSTGENQVLSLSFVGALVALCKEHAQRDTVHLFGKLGGMYPIVMDAAFGNLDVTYQGAIATSLPSMASQVVVLTTKSQAQGVVSDSLRPTVGAEYVIGLRTAKDDAAPESITLAGTNWDYVVPGADADSATLQKVS